MAGTYSLVGALAQKARGAKYNTGVPRDGDVSQPSLPGYARGTLGVTGARPIQSRNPDAGADRERNEIFKAMGINEPPKLNFTSAKVRAWLKYHGGR